MPQPRTLHKGAGTARLLYTLSVVGNLQFKVTIHHAAPQLAAMSLAGWLHRRTLMVHCTSRGNASSQGGSVQGRRWLAPCRGTCLLGRRRVSTTLLRGTARGKPSSDQSKAFNSLCARTYRTLRNLGLA